MQLDVSFEEFLCWADTDLSYIHPINFCVNPPLHTGKDKKLFLYLTKYQVMKTSYV